MPIIRALLGHKRSLHIALPLGRHRLGFHVARRPRRMGNEYVPTEEMVVRLELAEQAAERDHPKPQDERAGRPVYPTQGDQPES
jgi:hypothetical protein